MTINASPDTLRVIARNLLNARNNRIEGSIARAEMMEEKSEEALRRLFGELGAPITRQCALAAVNACVFWGADLNDFNEVLDGGSHEADVEFLVDALCSEWEGAMGGSEDTAFALELPVWVCVRNEMERQIL